MNKDVGRVPDETAFTEVGREKHSHAQFWVTQEGLHTTRVVVGTRDVQCPTLVARPA